MIDLEIHSGLNSIGFGSAIPCGKCFRFNRLVYAHIMDNGGFANEFSPIG